VSAEPVEPPEPAQPALSALEEALRRALATAGRDEVLTRVAIALPVEVDTGPDSRLHGEGQQRGQIQQDKGRFGKAQKVSVSMPADLVDLVRGLTGTGGFSRYVTDAVQERFQHDMLGALLDELEAEFGPVPPEIREQTRRMWPDQADD
jgi:hypothetical protein